MIITLPLRLITLHFSQIGFTEGLTFIATVLLLGTTVQPADMPSAYFTIENSIPVTGTRFPCALSAQLLGSPSDSALGQIIGRHLDSHLIARHDTNVVHPQLTGNVCQNGVLVLQLHLKHCIGQ